jgi:hypothetical protein
MNFLVKAALLLLLGAQSVASTALDDYVWKPDSNYNWVDLVSSEDVISHVGSVDSYVSPYFEYS